MWAEYQDELDDAIAEGGAPAWPTGCNQIDILKDKLFTNLPYMQGAFFYKDVAAKIGADKLDTDHRRLLQGPPQPAGAACRT